LNALTSTPTTRDSGRVGGDHAALRWSARLLFAASWIGGIVFAAYILLFFGGTLIGGAGQRWNESLPGLFDPGQWAATAAIGAHFAAGAVLLLLGPLQLIGALRRRWPMLHRGLGRVYVLSAAAAGAGGLVFIVVQGTVGGTVMDVGFGLYGGLMVLCAVMAFVEARARRIECHRAWAFRLFALTIGSWLYRMEYGAWSLLTGGIGMGSGFSGVFDMVMTFFFYLPNLAIAEVLIRARGQTRGVAANVITSIVLVAASGFVLLLTWAFASGGWGRRMAAGLMELPF